MAAFLRILFFPFFFSSHALQPTASMNLCRRPVTIFPLYANFFLNVFVSACMLKLTTMSSLFFFSRFFLQYPKVTKVVWIRKECVYYLQNVVLLEGYITFV